MTDGCKVCGERIEDNIAAGVVAYARCVGRGRGHRYEAVPVGHVKCAACSGAGKVINAKCDDDEGCDCHTCRACDGRGIIVRSSAAAAVLAADASRPVDAAAVERVRERLARRIGAAGIDTTNRFLVSSLHGDRIAILNPPLFARPMTKLEALTLAAWLVALAEDDTLTPSFEAVLAEVKGT